MKILTYRIPVDDMQVLELSEMFREILGRSPSAEFGDRLNEKRNLLVLIAEVEGVKVGFKIGYERYKGTFFSWLGGVLPAYRRRGIARALLRRQHEVCGAEGYSEIQTETSSEDTPMLILNLQEGFLVYGTFMARDKRLIVQLTRNLEELKKG